jgi:hypothetical protein
LRWNGSYRRSPSSTIAVSFGSPPRTEPMLEKPLVVVPGKRCTARSVSSARRGMFFTLLLREERARRELAGRESIAAGLYDDFFELRVLRGRAVGGQGRLPRG